ncbi:hypothetical protein HMPREF9278_0470 [Mobiluncus mulieris FB024-16]|nr:hypothetical protein HMPREF9278_0470 [Mobiluncus mulieris FB024-16]
MIIMADFVAVNGQVMTDEMMERLESYYARGEFPPGEYSVGEVIDGSPPSMRSGGVTIPVQIPLETQRVIASRAKEENTTPGELVGAVLTRVFTVP